jgi:hypothetical protein
MNAINFISSYPKQSLALQSYQQYVSYVSRLFVKIPYDMDGLLGMNMKDGRGSVH